MRLQNPSLNRPLRERTGPPEIKLTLPKSHGPVELSLVDTVEFSKHRYFGPSKFICLVLWAHSFPDDTYHKIYKDVSPDAALDDFTARAEKEILDSTSFAAFNVEKELPEVNKKFLRAFLRYFYPDAGWNAASIERVVTLCSIPGSIFLSTTACPDLEAACDILNHEELHGEINLLSPKHLKALAKGTKIVKQVGKKIPLSLLHESLPVEELRAEQFDVSSAWSYLTSYHNDLESCPHELWVMVFDRVPTQLTEDSSTRVIGAALAQALFRRVVKQLKQGNKQEEVVALRTAYDLVRECQRSSGVRAERDAQALVERGLVHSCNEL